jgi:hypothetical protein
VIRTDNRTKATPWGRPAWTLGLVVCLLIVGITAAARSDPQEPAAIAIDSISSANMNCRIAATKDGSRVYAVWDGFVAGRRRIVLRENIHGEWLSEILLDHDTPGQNHSPVLTVDDSGTPYVAWISESSTGGPSLLVTARAGDTWLPPSEIAVGEAGTTCDNLSVAATPGFPPTLWLTWQTIADGTYKICAARVEASRAGEARQWEVSSALSGASYNLAPQLAIIEGVPAIYWQTALDADFVPVAARFHAASESWTLTANVPLADMVPDNRFPSCTFGPGPTAGVVWIDQAAGLAAVRARVLTFDGKTPVASRVFTVFDCASIELPTVSATWLRPTAMLVACSYFDVASGPLLRASVVTPTNALDKSVTVLLPPECWPLRSLSIAAWNDYAAAVMASDVENGGDGHIYFVQFTVPR